jgi:hypothetical protein
MSSGLVGKKKRYNWKAEVLPAIQERLEAFSSQGIIPTLRAMFYALYSKEVIPNAQGYYQTLSEFTAICRRDGTLPINCFADNSRGIIRDFNDNYITLDQYVDEAINLLENAKTEYADSIPRWTNQPHYVEIWTEKDAMVGTLRSILQDREVIIAPIKGYDSVSNAYKNFKRLERKLAEEKQVHIRYFGDLDPSGEHIQENINNELRKQRFYFDASTLDIQRVAVTEEQIRQFRRESN